MMSNWFQHTSHANRDEKLAALRSELGFEGYGFYWFLVETIAESMHNSGQYSVKYPMKIWQRLTGLYPNKLKRLVNVLANIGLCSANVWPITEQCPEEHLEIFLPNIQKYIKTRNQNQKSEIKKSALEERRGEEIREEKKEEGQIELIPDPPKPMAEKPQAAYAFSGKIIKLSAPHLAEWKQSFHAIPDLVAELRQTDEYLQSPACLQKNKENWFLFVSGQLNRKHQEFMAKKQIQPPRGRYSEEKRNVVTL